MAKKINTILASASPRRLELLNLLNIYPDVKIPELDEIPVEGELPGNFVSRIAYEKGRSIAEKNNSENLTISADTIVLLDNMIIGKPSGREDAFKMLKLLAGKEHKVITGISLIYRGDKRIKNSMTEVKFSQLSDKEIEYYLDTEIFLDKAGAYAIQGNASIFVERINGCYFNVMGFPLNLFYSLIREFNISLNDLSSRP